MRLTYARCVSPLTLRDQGLEVVTTWEVILESTMLRYRLSFKAAESFLISMGTAFQIFYVSEADRLRSIEIFLKLTVWR